MREGNFPAEKHEENLRERKRISEEAIRELLEAKHTISNAGSKGIIFKFSDADIPEALRTVTEGSEARPATENASYAIKALKIYNTGEAEKEFEAMRRAHEVTADAEQKEALAPVPETSDFYEIEISETFQEFLNQNGAHLTQKKVGVIFMDYIEGEDLATLLYKEALRRQPGNPYVEEYIDTLSFNELHREVGAALHFARPGGKSRDEGERVFEEEMVKAANAKKLVQHLRKAGFTLPKEILTQLENTIDLLHRNGVFHNDLHERNVIIKDADLENPRSYVIDFGSATVGKKASGTRGIKISPDEAILDRLAPLLTTIRDEREAERSAERLQWEEKIIALKENSSFSQKYGAVREALLSSEEGDAALEKQLAIALAHDAGFEDFLVLLLIASREIPDRKDHIQHFLDDYIGTKKVRPFALNKIKAWQREVEMEAEA
jgi:serine/threonine protein kinase